MRIVTRLFRFTLIITVLMGFSILTALPVRAGSGNLPGDLSAVCQRSANDETIVTPIDSSLNGDTPGNSGTKEEAVHYTAGNGSSIVDWSTDTFTETLPGNDGSINTSIQVSLTGKTFTITDGVMTGNTHYAATFVPDGLSVVITGTSETTASIVLSGRAEAHAAADSIANLTIIFTNEAFTGGNAAGVANSNRNNLVVKYHDPNYVHWNDTTFLEAMPANDGMLESGLTVTVTGDTFVMTNGLMEEGSHFTAANVPAGLSIIITGTSSTTATVSLEGMAIAHGRGDGISNLTVTFLDPAFGGMNAANVRNSSRNDLVITFQDPVVMIWSTQIFEETVPANDGTISTVANLALLNEKFVKTNGLMVENLHYIVDNEPAGLTVVVTGTSATTATVALRGAAVAHEATNSVGNLTITFLSAAFKNSPAVFVDNSSQDWLEIIFVTGPADLTSLEENLEASFVPEFEPGVYNYTLTASAAETTLVLTAAFKGATITYFPDTLAEVVGSGEDYVVPLAVGVNTIRIKVEKRSYLTTFYTIGVTRAPVEEDVPVSENMTVPATGFTETGFMTDQQGVAAAGVVLTTERGDASLVIPAGTVLLDAEGQPLGSIIAEYIAEPPAPPPASTIALAYDFGPDGATFDPAITLSMPFSPESLPPGVAADNISIAWWDGNAWVPIETMVDSGSGIITAGVYHFTTFAVIIPEGVAAPTPPPATPVVTPEVESEPDGSVAALGGSVDEGNDTPVSDEQSAVGPDESSPVTEELLEAPQRLNWMVIVPGILAVLVVLFFVVRGVWNKMQE